MATSGATLVTGRRRDSAPGTPASSPHWGHDLVLVARRQESLEALAAELRGMHGVEAADTEFFGIAGESAALGKKRSARQVVERTIPELPSTKPSFVDGLANAPTAHLLTRITRAGC